MTEIELEVRVIESQRGRATVAVRDEQGTLLHRDRLDLDSAKSRSAFINKVRRKKPGVDVNVLEAQLLGAWVISRLTSTKWGIWHILRSYTGGIIKHFKVCCVSQWGIKLPSWSRDPAS